MINFTNFGEIDIRAATIMGVNAKEGASPIGFFGTGLKYAIANVLRLGGEIKILSGESEYQFKPISQEIRGKSFQLIELFDVIAGTRQPLGFTTDLGKAWEPWMVYRELFSNMKDEDGELLEDQLPPTAGLTQIQVWCSELEAVSLQKGDYFLNSYPLEDSVAMSIHPGKGRIFYQSIRVGQTTIPAIFDYNIKSNLDLTEDRTIKYHWDVSTKVRDFFQEFCLNEDLIHKVITARKEVFESSLNFSFIQASPQFRKEAARVFEREKAHLCPDLFSILKREEQRSVSRSTQIPEIKEKMLTKAKAFLIQHVGYLDDFPIFIEPLGGTCLGIAEGREIFLDPQVFDLGTKQVAITLYEEYLHLSRNFSDESRQFQDFLITKVISLAEELAGEPL